MPETWHGPCLWWHGLARLLGPHLPKKNSSSSFILQHKHLSSLKLLSKTSITKNLQTFISPSILHQNTKFLHPIISKHNHQSKTTFIHPNHKSTKFVYPIKLTQKPQIIHQSQQLNSKTLLKPQPHNQTNIFHPKPYQTLTFTKTHTKSN